MYKLFSKYEVVVKYSIRDTEDQENILIANLCNRPEDQTKAIGVKIKEVDLLKKFSTSK